MMIFNEYIFTGNDDHTVKKWSIVDDTLLVTYFDHFNVSEIMYFNENQFITISQNRYYKLQSICNINDVHDIGILPVNVNKIQCIEINTYWFDIFSIIGKSELYYKQENHILSLKGHSSYIISLLILTNGHLISGSSDKMFKIWHLFTMNCIFSMNIEISPLFMAISPFNDSLFIVDDNGSSIQIHLNKIFQDLNDIENLLTDLKS